MSNNIKMSTLTDLIVRKSNLLIESGTNMTLLEQRIILTTMAQVLVNDLDFETYSFTVSQLAMLFGLESSSLHKEVRKVSDSLMEKFFRIPKKGVNDFRNQSVVDFIDYTHGILSIKLAQGLKSELLNLKKMGHFTSYDIEEIVKLRRTSSMRLYEILIRDRRLNRKTSFWIQKFPLSDIRDFLYLENSYSDFRSFNQKILKPSIQEINEHTNIRVEYTPIRAGRVTTEIEFKMWERLDLSDSAKERSDEDLERLEEIERHLSVSTPDEKERFEKIFEDMKKENHQLSLFTGSYLHDSLRFKALQEWFNTI